MSAVSTMLLVGIGVLRHHPCADDRHPHHHAGQRPRSVRHHQARPPSARRLADDQHGSRFAAQMVMGVFHHLTTQGDRFHRRELHIGARHHPRHVRHGRVGGHPRRGARRLADDLARAGGQRAARRARHHRAQGGGACRWSPSPSSWSPPVLLTGVWPVVLQRSASIRTRRRWNRPISNVISRPTKQAYGLDYIARRGVRRHHRGRGGAPLSASAESTAQIRLLDPQIVSPTFKQLQQSRPVLHLRRHARPWTSTNVNGVSQDTVIAARRA